MKILVVFSSTLLCFSISLQALPVSLKSTCYANLLHEYEFVLDFFVPESFVKINETIQKEKKDSKEKDTCKMPSSLSSISYDLKENKKKIFKIQDKKFRYLEIPFQEFTSQKTFLLKIPIEITEQNSYLRDAYQIDFEYNDLIDTHCWPLEINTFKMSENKVKVKRKLTVDHGFSPYKQSVLEYVYESYIQVNTTFIKIKFEYEIVEYMKKTERVFKNLFDAKKNEDFNRGLLLIDDWLDYLKIEAI